VRPALEAVLAQERDERSSIVEGFQRLAEALE
jgi:hypothetical protein